MTRYKKMIEKHGLKWVREYYRKKALERRDRLGDSYREYRRSLRDKNKSHINKTKRNWRANRSILQKERDRAYYQYRSKTQPEKVKGWIAVWRSRNKKRLKEYQSSNRNKIAANVRSYRRRNSDKLKQRHKDRYASDIAYCMKIRLRARMGVAFRRAKAKKSDHFIELIGCTERELLSHLQSQFLEGMTWENRNTWHIDHIRACAKFNLSDPRQQKACFHYTNLQPLWGSDNMSKGSK